MARGDALRIRRYLVAQVARARERGDRTITLCSGDVHKALGLVERMPNVCQVLRGPKLHEQARWSKYVISSAHLRAKAHGSP